MPLVGARDGDTSFRTRRHIYIFRAQLPRLVHQRNDRAALHPPDHLAIDRAQLATIGDDVGFGDDLAILWCDYVDSLLDLSASRQLHQSVRNFRDASVTRVAREGEQSRRAAHSRENRCDRIRTRRSLGQHGAARQIEVARRIPRASTP